jgi:hypothetical protein
MTTLYFVARNQNTKLKSSLADVEGLFTPQHPVDPWFHGLPWDLLPNLLLSTTRSDKRLKLGHSSLATSDLWWPLGPVRWGHGCQVRGHRPVPGSSPIVPSFEFFRQMDIVKWCILPGRKDLVKGEGLQQQCECDRHWGKEQSRPKVTLKLSLGVYAYQPISSRIWKLRDKPGGLVRPGLASAKKPCRPLCGQLWI